MADHERPPELKDVLVRLAYCEKRIEQLKQDRESDLIRWLGIEKPDCPAGRECARVRGVREWDRDG